MNEHKTTMDVGFVTTRRHAACRYFVRFVCTHVLCRLLQMSRLKQKVIHLKTAIHCIQFMKILIGKCEWKLLFGEIYEILNTDFFTNFYIRGNSKYSLLI